MPIIKSAQKAARQAIKHTAHNREIKKEIKAAVKAFKANPSFESFTKAQSEYDKAAKKGLIKKNTAARRKAVLAKLAKDAGVKFEKIKQAAAKASKPAAKAAKPATKTTKSAAKASAKTTKPTTKKTPAKKTATKKA